MIVIKEKNITTNLKKLRRFSSLVEAKMSKMNDDENKVEKLSFEQLQDMNQLLQIADYILCKYEDKKEVHSLLKEFVEMINTSTISTDLLNDDINELIVSAESTISHIKNVQNDVSENFAFSGKKSVSKDDVSENVPKTSTINLTKSTIPVYTQEYLQKSEMETG